MSRDRFDLHTHSTASDGVLAPREVVALAAERGLGGIALTDHDTVDGIREAMGAAHVLDIRCLAGIELTCTTALAPDVHVLGYGIDTDSDALAAIIVELRRQRDERVRTIVDRLRALGVSLTLADVHAVSGDAPPARPHVARALVAAGVIEDIEQAFTHEWIGVGGRAYVPRDGVDLARAVDVIHDAGGVTVLAHPGERDTVGVLDDLVRLAASAGVDGVEVDHPSHDGDVVHRLADLAVELGLVQTAGSDDHGSGVDGSRLGCRTVPSRIVDALDARCHARRARQ